MFLISGLLPTTSVYISIFKVDLAGNNRQIELGYEMDITTFKLLFKLAGKMKDEISIFFINIKNRIWSTH